MKKFLVALVVVMMFLSTAGFVSAQTVDVQNQNQLDQQQQQSQIGGTQNINLTQQGAKIPRSLPGTGEIIIPQILPYAGDRSVSPGMVSPQILLQFGAEFSYEQLEPYSRYWGYDLYAPMQVPERKEWSRQDKVRFIFRWPAETDQNGNPRVDQFGFPVFSHAPKQVGHINAYTTSTNYKQMMGNLAHAGKHAIKHGVPFLFVAAYGSEREMAAKMLGAMIGGGQAAVNSNDDSKGYMGVGGFGGAMGAAKTSDKPWIQLIALQGEVPPIPAIPKAEVVPQKDNAEKEKTIVLLAKDETLKYPICPISIGFPFEKWQPSDAERREKISKIAEWLAKNWPEAEKREMQWAVVGHADERGPTPAEKDRINPYLGEWRAKYARAIIADELIAKHGFTREQVKEITWVGAGKNFSVIPGATTEEAHQKNRQAYIILIAPGVQGYNTK